MRRALDLATVGEIAAVLATHPRVACRPSLDTDPKANEYVLTIAFPIEGATRTELFYALQEAIDVASLRGLASRYGVDAAELERFVFAKERKP